MRYRAFRLALEHQREALMHAEPVLLVNDDQSQGRETHVLLKQRMGTDGDGYVTGLQRRIDLPARSRCDRAR
jgi:hypothetical protein